MATNNDRPALASRRSSTPSAEIIRSLPLSGRVVALTFDDGWCSKCVDKALHVLLSSGAHASICPNGAAGHASWDKQASLVRLLVSRGQLSLCNHTFLHRDAVQSSKISLEEDVRRDGIWIMKEFRVSAKPYFRPPYGSFNASTLEIAAGLGYPYVVLWSVDLGDASPGAPTADSEISRLVDGISPGAIVVAHLNRMVTASSLPSVLTWLATNKYRTVTLDELFELSNEKTRSAGCGTTGKMRLRKMTTSGLCEHE